MHLPAPKLACPNCGSASRRWVRYAFSSWLLPLACDTCGARFYLGYHPGVFILLWGFLSPLYMIGLLFLSMVLFPERLVLAGFFALAFPSAFLLIFLGRPKLKKPPA